MVQRICLLGRDGSGKSTIAQNLCHALSLMGKKVLLVGDDISMSSTLLLRGCADILPALEDYRDKYEISLNDYILPTKSGVYCIELGSLEPGIGCMVRSIHLLDDMLEEQQVPQKLGLDIILYDLAGDVPCTGYMLPVRDGLMARCIVVTSGSFAFMATANSILQAICNTNPAVLQSTQLLVNNANLYNTRTQVNEYAGLTGIPILGYVHHSRLLEDSMLGQKTIFDFSPSSGVASFFRSLAAALLEPPAPGCKGPLPRREMLRWLAEWQRKDLALRSGEISVDNGGYL
ncbi:MAG: hypothetical protein ACK5L3_05940 [Oscillospiraceae bacterium]